MRHYVGFDVGKGSHWACVLDAESEVVLSRRVEATEEALEAACKEIAGLGVTDERVVGIDLMGGPAALLEVPTTTRGYERLLRWAEGFGPLGCAGIEGTSSYGPEPHTRSKPRRIAQGVPQVGRPDLGASGRRQHLLTGMVPGVRRGVKSVFARVIIPSFSCKLLSRAVP